MKLQIPILDSGKHHLVVNKPYNMVVVAGRGAPKPTLLDVFQESHGKGIKPVHRLDRVTSGCCILAKDTYGQQALSNAFRKHLIDKRYLAIVEGKPAFDSLAIDARLARIDDPDARKGYLAQQTIDPEGQRAMTRVKVWAKSDEFSVVEARPETGRMHQIRAHLAHVGHPIVGDKQYGSKTSFEVDHGIALLAFAVSFPAPDGGRRFIHAPLPTSFASFLNNVPLDVCERFKQETERFGITKNSRY